MTYRTPTPATRASRLVDQLRSFASVGEPDDLALQRIEQEARGLMTADPVGAHTVLGVLASLRGNAEDVRYHNDIALQQSGRIADTLNNYSVCLLRIGEAVEAFEFAREAFQRAPDNSVVLRQLIRAAIESAHFREARDLCDRWPASDPLSVIARNTLGRPVRRPSASLNSLRRSPMRRLRAGTAGTSASGCKCRTSMPGTGPG